MPLREKLINQYAKSLSSRLKSVALKAEKEEHLRVEVEKELSLLESEAGIKFQAQLNLPLQADSLTAFTIA